MKKTLDATTKMRYEMIHKALHNPQAEGVTINYEPFPIKMSRNKQRFLTWQGNTFITQDPSKSTTYAQMQKEGKRVTRILRSGAPWGLIINEAIVKP